MPTETVLFDADCALCRTLAEHMARRAPAGLEFKAWQEFTADAGGAAAGLTAAERAAPADRLRLWTGEALLEGEAAWARLVAAHPDLAALDWLAIRLGLRGGAARALAGAGAALRRLCPGCTPPGLRALAARRRG